MKYVLLIVLLFLIGCSNPPKFKVGDCIEKHSSYLEDWEEEDIKIRHKILQIGKTHYIVTNDIGMLFDTFDYIDEYYRKIDCSLMGENK